NPRIATLGIIGSLNWLTHWYRPEGPLRADAIADQFCDMFLAGLINRSNASTAVKTAKPRATARKTA
ncbi:MAG: TetR/AcrR family transcriptional regulator, partial [Actinomycetota bacterium]